MSNVHLGKRNPPLNQFLSLCLSKKFIYITYKLKIPEYESKRDLGAERV